MKTEEEERLIAHAVTRLSAKYPSISADVVADAVASAHAHFDIGSVISFLCSSSAWRGRNFLAGRFIKAVSAAEESDIEQSRVFLALLNSEIDELSERIESALRLARGTRPVGSAQASAARTDAAALRKDLHRVHRLVEQLIRRFPAATFPADHSSVPQGLPLQH